MPTPFPPAPDPRVQRFTADGRPTPAQVNYEIRLAAFFQGLMNGPTSVASFATAALPIGSNGLLAFATDGRKVGEAAGSGTGVMVAYSNSAWRRLSDDTPVAT